MTRYTNDEGINDLQDLEKVMKNLQNKKSPEEEIDSVLYKCASDFICILLNFYSNIYTSRETQTEWDNAIMAPIFKTETKTSHKLCSYQFIKHML
jgi:hypothetical protein